MAKILEKIKNFITGVLICIFFTFTITITVLLLNFNKYGLTQFGNTTFVMVADHISSETFKKGDMVLVDYKKISELEVGNEIFVYRILGSNKVLVEIGKVGQIYLEEDAVAFENGDVFSNEFIIGTATKKYEKVGTFLSIVESKWASYLLY